MTQPTQAPITPWLQLLSQLAPPAGVLLVGAGNGVGPWVQLLQTLAVPSVTLVEADDTQFEHLQRSVPQRDGWRLRKQVVGPRTDTVTYHQASNATESGLLEPESLRSLWPNLKTTHKQTRQAITLADLQDDADTPANWLLLDCLPALPILQGAAQQLAAFDVISLRVLLAENAVPGSAAGADEVQATLQEQGFRCLALEASRHPGVGHALFVRDTAKQAKQREEQLAKNLAALQAQNSTLTQEKAKLIAASAELTKSRDQLATQLAAETKTKAEIQAQRDAQAKATVEALAQRDAEAKAKTEAIAQRDALAKEKTALIAARDEQAKLAADRETALAAQQKDATAKQQRLQQLEADNQELAARQHLLQEQLIKAEAQVPAPSALQPPPLGKGFEEIREALAQQKKDLDTQLKKQTDELVRMRKFLDASLEKKLLNATKQIEAAVGLQSYFATGELPNINTERHSWPISTDFAFYLVQLLETNDYDIVIEFGSGISTVIIAKTLAKMALRRLDKPPVAFVSFDHLEQYANQTQAQLKQADLADKVQLELAPLQAYTAPNGNTYPYYTCHAALAKLAHQNPPAGKRVLVLVDGPPAATGQHARYPAAPSVLTYFKGASIDFLLDDYIRDDEKEIAALWQAEFSAENIIHKTSERKLEKDACLISTRAQVC